MPVFQVLALAQGFGDQSIRLKMRLNIALSLFVFWLILSGHYETRLIVIGGICAIAISAFVHRLGVADQEGHPIGLIPRALVYWPWLIKEIIISALNVSRIIVDPRLPISPTLVRVRTGQKTAVGIATYANSITLTPGTISAEVSVSDSEILVHALSRDSAADLADGEMNRRIEWFEGGAK